MLSRDRIDIGPVRPDELDRMLAIMCEAFEMPFEAARPIFYADPYFDINTKWVLRSGGEVASCLTMVETHAWVGEGILPLVGIAGVATRRELRNQGYAGALLQDTLSYLRSRRVGLCALVAASPAYYAKFGWADAGTVSSLRIRRDALPHQGEAGSVEPALEEDIPYLSALYSACSRGKTLRLVRDEKRWKHLLRYIPIAKIFRTAQGKPEGYLLARLRPGPLQSLAPYVAQGATLEILEKVGVSHEANEALMCSVKGVTEAEFVEITCPESERTGYGLTGEPSFEERCQGTVASTQTVATQTVRIAERGQGTMASTQMVRIVDAEALFAQLAAEWKSWQGVIELVVEDPMVAGGADCIRIEGRDRISPAVQRVAEGSAGVEWGAYGDVQVWSQLVVGAVRVDQAVAQKRLRLSKPEAAEMLAGLFPSSEPFLPLPDRF